MKNKFFFTLTLIVIIFTSCGIFQQGDKTLNKNSTDKTNQEFLDQPISLFQTEWELIRMGSSKPKLTENENKVSILFSKDNSHFTGFSGCNRYSGKYEIKRGNLTFDNVACTKMACPDINMNFENNYLNALNKVNNFSIVADTLFLNNGERPILIFIAK